MNRFTRSFKKILNRFPAPLPRGMTEFEVWARDVILTYNLPDNDSVRFMLGAIMLQLKETDASKPKHYFGQCGLLAASKEIAHATLTQLKAAQDAKVKADVDAQKKAASDAAITAANSPQLEATVTSITSASSAKQNTPTVS